MTIHVKFFASLREQLGKSEVELDTDSAITVLAVWQQVTDHSPLPENTLLAVNMEYVNSSCAVKSGDEVAFFPPVTGG